jgi:hypothetical protein
MICNNLIRSADGEVDAEMAALIAAERSDLEAQLLQLDSEIMQQLVPKYVKIIQSPLTDSTQLLMLCAHRIIGTTRTRRAFWSR